MPRNAFSRAGLQQPLVQRFFVAPGVDDTGCGGTKAQGIGEAVAVPGAARKKRRSALTIDLV
jgi:hypothetical protein